MVNRWVNDIQNRRLGPQSANEDPSDSDSIIFCQQPCDSSPGLSGVGNIRLVQKHQACRVCRRIFKNPICVGKNTGNGGLADSGPGTLQASHPKSGSKLGPKYCPGVGTTRGHRDAKQWRGPYKVLYNFLVTAPDIMGPWSEPVFLNSSGFDPAL